MKLYTEDLLPDWMIEELNRIEREKKQDNAPRIYIEPPEPLEQLPGPKPEDRKIKISFEI